MADEMAIDESVKKLEERLAAVAGTVEQSGQRFDALSKLVSRLCGLLYQASRNRQWGTDELDDALKVLAAKAKVTDDDTAA